METALTYEVALSTVTIDPRVNQSRTPVLPAAARGHDFERRFDHLTLFNDIFWDHDGDSILAIGPMSQRISIPKSMSSFTAWRPAGNSRQRSALPALPCTMTCIAFGPRAAHPSCR
jgi:hypothetical protein